MASRSLIVDGMLSGTGVRDAVAGGYVKLNEIGLSSGLVTRIANWLLAYENAHYYQFNDNLENERLDKEGRAIAREVQEELPGAKIEYFSNAEMRKIPL
ncbi:MAG: hypothetical protein ACRC9K_12475 [Afipia sp.]